MEIRARLDFRKIVILLYVVCFVAYLIFGLTPTSAGVTHYEISANLEIPAIDLNTDVTALTLENRRLETPDTVVGSYSRAKNKTLLIGHSSTVFSELDRVWVGDNVMYNGATYIAKDIIVDKKENISMNKLLSSTKNDTLVIMTCTGTYLGNGDSTHRLIITAEITPSLD